MYKRLKIPCIMIILLFLIACSGLTANLDFRDMTAKDYVTLAMGEYTMQFERHQEDAALPNLTPERKADLQDLKKVLNKVYPAIRACNLAIDTGGTPTQANMQILMDFLTKYYYGRK